MKTIPHQSSYPRVRFPGAYIAARELGVNRTHLHRVLTGERPSKSLAIKWQGWLKRHPEFAKLNQH
jgi:hypothetical protein